MKIGYFLIKRLVLASMSIRDPTDKNRGSRGSEEAVA